MEITHVLRDFFIGKGHTIYTNWWDPDLYNYYGSFGLFGYVASGIVENLRMDGVIEGSEISNVGAIVGFVEKSTIENCIVSGYIESSGNCLGGVVRESY